MQRDEARYRPAAEKDTGGMVKDRRIPKWRFSGNFSTRPGSRRAFSANLGCGGGRNAGELLKKYPAAHVTAIDYSALCVEKAKSYNRAMIAAGRCTVRQGDVSALDLPEASFDLATAFETVYFWPGLQKCFAEAAKVLKLGGYFLICNESDGTDPTGTKFETIIDGMKSYTAQEIEAALKAAGFSQVTTDHHPAKPWIAVLARK